MRSTWPRSIAVVVLGVTAGVILAADRSSNWKVPAREAEKKNPILADEKSIAKGKAVYAQNCLACHGPAGKGDGPKAAELQPKPRDLSSPEVAGQGDGELYWKITEGRRPMPAFGKLISDEDRWHAINYIHTFRQNERPQKKN